MGCLWTRANYFQAVVVPRMWAPCWMYSKVQSLTDSSLTLQEPGQPRRGSSRPPSLPGSSLLGRGAFNLSQGDPVSNNIFPWDNAGPSSSNAPLPGSFGANASELGLSLDGTMVRFNRGSRTSNGRESPIVHPESMSGEAGDEMRHSDRMEFDGKHHYGFIFQVGRLSYIP